VCMERSTWTDERLDDMVARADSQFELLRGEIGELRGDLRREIGELREEMRGSIGELREEMRGSIGELHAVRRDMFHGAIALFGSQVAILAVLLAQSL